MRSFYYQLADNAPTWKNGEVIPLTEHIYHHWCRVLRAQIGDMAIFFTGLGGEYQVKICTLDKKSASAEVCGFVPENRNLNVTVTLGQVMSKGDRMDFVIQKATELGVSKIQLLTSDRCEMRLKYERDAKKIEHWQAIAVSACEQCGLNLIPKILPPLALPDWLMQIDADMKVVLSLSDQNFSFSTPLPQHIALLVGPEGGLSEAEIQLATAQQFIPWTIGHRVLRTETAPIAALSIVNYLA